MVIYDLHIVEIIFFHLKTNPILIIYPNAILSLPVTGKWLQPIDGRDFQILQTPCIIYHDQFS